MSIAGGTSGIRWSATAAEDLRAAAEAVDISDTTGVLVHDAVGAIVGANELASRLLRLSWEQLTGADPWDSRWAALGEDGTLLDPADTPALRTLASGIDVHDAMFGVTVVGVDRVPHVHWLSSASRAIGSPVVGVLALLSDADGTPRAGTASLRYTSRGRAVDAEMADVSLTVDRRGIVTSAAATVEHVLGRSPHELVGQPLVAAVHPDDAADVLVALTDARSRNQLMARTVRMRAADDHLVWMALRAQLPDEGGSASVALARIDPSTVAGEHLMRVESRYKLLAEHVSDIVWQADPYTRIMWISESVTSVLGWRRDEVLGRLAIDFVAPDDLDGARDELQAVLDGGRSTGQYRLLCADGSWRSMSADVHRVDTPDGVTLVAAVRDVHDQVVARRALDFALGHDSLTGLINLGQLESQVDALLDRNITTTRGSAQPSNPDAGDLGQPGADAGKRPSAESGARALAVLCIGVDGLTAVNEALTHAAGDEVLTCLAGRMRSALTDGEILARGSGDEFLALAPDLDSAVDASLVAERLRTAAHGDIEVGGMTIVPTVSIGIAVGSPHAAGGDLIRDGSLAMRVAKAKGRDRFEFADAALTANAHHRLEVLGDIRAGLRRGEFEPWFQPIVALAGQRLVGYEALVRWVRPDGTVAPPGDFLPIAEASDVIAELDLAVARGSVALLASQPGVGHVSVNVSPVTLASIQYLALIEDLLLDSNVAPDRLHIEITETALLSIPASVRSSMFQLAERGIKWYVDDFGTGYSSLAHLRDLPIAGIKLDLSFTAGIREGDLTSERLAKALAGLAQGLDIDTVAEGIETPLESAVLRAQGWQHAQGWLFGRPTPVSGLSDPG